MAYEIIWTLDALEDLGNIADYIGKDSEMHAQEVTDRMIEVAESVADFPNLGRMVPEFGDVTIRERFVFSYRILYKIIDFQVIIVAVIHGKRLLDNLE